MITPARLCSRRVLCVILNLMAVRSYYTQRHTAHGRVERSCVAAATATWAEDMRSSYAVMNAAIAASYDDDDDLSGMLDPWRTTAFVDESITHTEGIRRATRKSLYDQFANTDVREDHTLHDLREPCWHPPHDVLDVRRVLVLVRVVAHL